MEGVSKACVVQVLTAEYWRWMEEREGGLMANGGQVGACGGQLRRQTEETGARGWGLRMAYSETDARRENTGR